jgi:threonine dehydratase
MFRSWREGRAVDAPAETIASALAVARPVPASVERIRPLIDEFVLIEDADMIHAMRVAAHTLGMLLEPAGAAGIAAIWRHDLEGERFAVLLTGQGVPRALRDAVSGSERND